MYVYIYIYISILVIPGRALGRALGGRGALRAVRSLAAELSQSAAAYPSRHFGLGDLDLRGLGPGLTLGAGRFWFRPLGHGILQLEVGGCSLGRCSPRAFGDEDVHVAVERQDQRGACHPLTHSHCPFQAR